MNIQDVITLSIKSEKSPLNEFFACAIGDRPQGTIILPSSQGIDLANIVKNLGPEDLLISNAKYLEENCDFYLIDNNKRVVLNVSEDGQQINRHSFDYYLDPYELNKLLQIFYKIQESNIYTIAVEKEN